MKRLAVFLFMAFFLMTSRAFAFDTGSWTGDWAPEALYGELEIAKAGQDYKARLFIFELAEENGGANAAHGYLLEDAKGVEKDGALLLYYKGKPAFSIENRGGLKVAALAPLASLPKNVDGKVYLKAADVAKMKWKKN